MKRVKCSYIQDDDDDDDDYKKVPQIIEEIEEELPQKVKYKTILEEEDFLPE